MRKQAILRCLNVEISKNGASGQLKPREQHSNDSIRFVGDILAFIHQCTCSELELFSQLLSTEVKQIKENNPRPQPSDPRQTTLSGRQNYRFRSESSVSKEKFEQQQQLVTLVNRVMEGCCRSLRSHIDPILSFKDLNTCTLYKLANLMQFFSHTIQLTFHSLPSTANKIKSREDVEQMEMASPLCFYLQEITYNSFKNFYDSLHREAALLHPQQQLRHPTPADVIDLTTLHPSSLILNAIENLKQLMNDYDDSFLLPFSPTTTDINSKAFLSTSVAVGGDGFLQAEDAQSGFDPILAILLTPMLQQCAGDASLLKSALDSKRYHCNCLRAISACLHLHESFTQKWCTVVDESLDAEIGHLNAEQV